MWLGRTTFSEVIARHASAGKKFVISAPKDSRLLSDAGVWAAARNACFATHAYAAASVVTPPCWPQTLPVHGPLVVAEFDELAGGIQQQREQLERQAKALLAPLRVLWEQHTAALLAGSEGWARRGAVAAAALAAIRELMHVLQDFEGIEDHLTALLTELHQAAAAIAPQLLSGPLAAAALAADGGAAGDAQAQRWQALGKSWERLLQVALVTMDRWG
jgi:hypothetical protein